MTGLNRFKIALSVATALSASQLVAKEPASDLASLEQSVPSLEQQFRDPPQSARPRVWWHWMNGNVSKDGIAKDLAWMSRVGIGGLQNFDANLQTPQIVDHRLVYMTPEWKDAFRFTAQEADRLGLELAIAASPGWSETGGPWVKPEDGLKKLVWSVTEIDGGKPFLGTLGPPPSMTGPFQSMPKMDPIAGLSGKAPEKAPEHYGDIAVLAFPAAARENAPLPHVSLSGSPSADGADLFDDDMASGIRLDAGTPEKQGFLALSYDKARTVRAATAFMPDPMAAIIGNAVDSRLEVSDDGVAWRPVARIPSGAVPTTVSFAPVTARHFRLVLVPTDKSAFLDAREAAPGIAMSDYRGLLSQMGGKSVKVTLFRLDDEPLVDRFETKAGFALTPDYYALSSTVPDEQGVPVDQVIDLTSRLQADGTLNWTPSKGRWRVVRLGYSLLGTTNHPAPAEATGLEVDKFDGPAVRRYLEHYIGMYRDAAGSDLVGRRGVQALLTDSIEVGAANWTPRMIAQFKRLRGYDPTPWLPALTGTIISSRADTDKFLYDYRRTLADLMASEHYGTVAAVAHENGLRVYGEALEDHRPSLGDDMAMRSHADVPMAAMWTHSREKGAKPTYVADIRGAASVAHICGQNLVAAESMTAAMNPWNYGPADLKRIIDLEFVNGVNRPVIHTSVHQPVDDKVPGLSLFIFGQYFNRHEAWAEMARPWVDYMARNSLMLQQGRNVADVAYFYGEEAPLTGLYGDKLVADAPKAHAYDFVNADALESALVNDGAELVTAGGSRYRALYLGGSSRKMTLAALRRLAFLVEGGATVVGMKPEGTPSLAGDATEYNALVNKLWPGGEEVQVGKGRVLALADIDVALSRIGVSHDFSFAGGQTDTEIPFLHRKLPDGDSWFLVNRKNRNETVEAHFRVAGKAPELWHAETGTSEAVSYRIENGETIVPLTLRADESVHVVFRKAATADTVTIRQGEPVALATLTGPWDIAFQAGRGAPATARVEALAPLDESKVDGIRYFSGIATYTRDFTTPRGWKAGQRLWLDLGEAREVAEVSVNGKPAGSVWHAPYRLDIAAQARTGRNRVEIRVANLWVNRLIGDQQPGAQKVTWTALPAYRADAPLRRSGLIGPVTLLGAPAGK